MLVRRIRTEGASHDPVAHDPVAHAHGHGHGADGHLDSFAMTFPVLQD